MTVNKVDKLQLYLLFYYQLQYILQHLGKGGPLCISTL